MSKNFTQPFWGEVEVSGGQGSLVIPVTDFRIDHISIRPPSSSAVYDFKLFSAENFLMAGDVNIKGEFARQTSFPMYKNGMFEINNADVDGTYAIQITRENLYG